MNNLWDIIIRFLSRLFRIKTDVQPTEEVKNTDSKDCKVYECEILDIEEIEDEENLNFDV